VAPSARGMHQSHSSEVQTAAQQVLRLPELIDTIIKECAKITQQDGQVIRWQHRKYQQRSRGLRQRRDALFRCLLVNRTWNAIATRYLWELFPPSKAFLNLPLTRRQYFANMVRATEIGVTGSTSFEKSVHEPIPGIEQFPNLLNLNFGTIISDPHFQQLCAMYLHTPLQHLRLRGLRGVGFRDLIVDRLFPLLQVFYPFMIRQAIYH
jgi:hypothetical protein